MKRQAWFSLLLMTVLSIIISRGVLFNVLKIILAMRAYFACARGSVGTARQLRLCDAAPACEAGDPANLGSLGSAPPGAMARCPFDLRCEELEEMIDEARATSDYRYELIRNFLGDDFRQYVLLSLIHI